jgi:hypothetical protein
MKSGCGLCCPVTQVADVAAERWTHAASPRRDGCIASYSCAKGSYNNGASTGVNHRLSPLLSGQSLQGVEIGRCENHQEFTRRHRRGEVHHHRYESWLGFDQRKRLNSSSLPSWTRVRNTRIILCACPPLKNARVCAILRPCSCRLILVPDQRRERRRMLGYAIDTPHGKSRGILGSPPRPTPRLPEGFAQAVLYFSRRCARDAGLVHSPGRYASGRTSLSGR